MKKTTDIRPGFFRLMDRLVYSTMPIKEKRAKQYEEYFQKMDLDPLQLLHAFIAYWERVFVLGEHLYLRKKLEPIPNGRLHEIVVEVYLKVFSGIFDDLFHSRPGYDLGHLRKQDFIAFLCGITDDLHDDYQKIWDNYHNLSESNEPILITGETGTGKELHAKLFHLLSTRKKKPFIAVNCSGIPDALLESQMFGHEKGAFTGADTQTRGLFEAVGDGTLFLDEIGDMSTALQAKLLRVLETGDYFRVGNFEHKLTFQGRIIAATNLNLWEEIQKPEPRFRPDLFYRISVFQIRLQPFRDLPLILRGKKLDYLLDRLCHQYQIVDKTILEDRLTNKASLITSHNYTPSDQGFLSPDARQALLEYDYPGNFRELLNVLKSAILRSGGAITLDYLPASIRQCKDSPTTEEDQTEKHINGDLSAVKLRDIFSYGDELKRSAVETKIRQILRSGRPIKHMLQEEGLTGISEYNNFMKKLETILGQGPLRRLKN